MVTKAKVREQIDKMPDKFTIDELVERLVFVNKVEQGLSDSKNGDKIDENELEKEIKKWFK